MTMPWRNYIGNDTGWKLFSLLMAILIWGSIRSGVDDGVARKVVVNPLRAAQTEPDRTREPLTRPVAVLRTPADQHRYRVLPPLVQVVVRGSPADLETLDDDDVRVFIDVADFEADPRAIAGKAPCAVQVHVPPGISFVKSEPSAVMVERLPPHPDGTQLNPAP